MKRKGLSFFFACCLALFLTSCVHNEGEYVGWVLFLQDNDTVTVDYPVTVFGSSGHAVFSNKKVDFETVEVKGDTTIEGSNVAVNGVDFTNIEVHVTRQTRHDAVHILFIRDICLPFNMYGIKDGQYVIDQQVLDSMMNLYSVILPIDQEQITVPILTRLN